jgi:hypothetical protein
LAPPPLPLVCEKEKGRQREENIKVCNEAREGGRETRSNFGELIYCLTDMRTHTCGFSHTYTRTPTQTGIRIQTKYKVYSRETKITFAWHYALIYFWFMQ